MESAYLKRAQLSNNYLTRTRAFVYIAFCDEYVGGHINTLAGLSIFFFIPINLYDIQVNRICEQNANHYLYNWQFFDKRNRLTHNFCMEHFKMHKEQFEDLIVEMHTYGPKEFAELPAKAPYRELTMIDFGLIDEMSGLTNYLENFMLQQNLPETTKTRIRAHIPWYESPKPKKIALNELRISIFGD